MAQCGGAPALDSNSEVDEEDLDDDAESESEYTVDDVLPDEFWPIVSIQLLALVLPVEWLERINERMRITNAPHYQHVVSPGHMRALTTVDADIETLKRKFRQPRVVLVKVQCLSKDNNPDVWGSTHQAKKRIKLHYDHVLVPGPTPHEPTPWLVSCTKQQAMQTAELSLNAILPLELFGHARRRVKMAGPTEPMRLRAIATYKTRTFNPPDHISRVIMEQMAETIRHLQGADFRVQAILAALTKTE